MSPPFQPPALSPTRRYHLRAVLALAAAGTVAWVVGCGSLLGPREVLITTEELTVRLARRFPIEKRLMQLLDVSLGAPVLRMLPEQNRVATTLPLSVRSRLLGSGTSQGEVSLSFGLRFEPDDLTLRLTALTVDGIEVPGLAPALVKAITSASTWLGEDALKDAVLHQFRAEELRSVERLGLRVTHIRVTSGGIAVALARQE